MQKIISYLSKLDYLVAIGCVLWGIYYSDYLVMAAGVLGFFLARLNLAQRVQKRLEKYLVKKKTTEDHSSLLAEQEKIYDENLLSTASKADITFKNLPAIQYTVVQIMPSKHNLLAKPGALTQTANNNNHFC